MGIVKTVVDEFVDRDGHAPILGEVEIEVGLAAGAGSQAAVDAAAIDAAGKVDALGKVGRDIGLISTCLTNFSCRIISHTIGNDFCAFLANAVFYELIRGTEFAL